MMDGFEFWAGGGILSPVCRRRHSGPTAPPHYRQPPQATPPFPHCSPLHLRATGPPSPSPPRHKLYPSHLAPRTVFSSHCQHARPRALERQRAGWHVAAPPAGHKLGAAGGRRTAAAPGTRVTESGHGSSLSYSFWEWNLGVGSGFTLLRQDPGPESVWQLCGSQFGRVRRASDRAATRSARRGGLLGGRNPVIPSRSRTRWPNIATRQTSPLNQHTHN